MFVVTPVVMVSVESAAHADATCARYRVLTIARLGADGRAADYYLDRKAGCEEEPERARAGAAPGARGVPGGRGWPGCGRRGVGPACGVPGRGWQRRVRGGGAACRGAGGRAPGRTGLDVLGPQEREHLVRAKRAGGGGRG